MEICFQREIAAAYPNLASTVIANLRPEPKARAEIGKSCKFFKSDPAGERGGIRTLMNITFKSGLKFVQADAIKYESKKKCISEKMLINPCTEMVKLEVFSLYICNQSLCYHVIYLNPFEPFSTISIFSLVSTMIFFIYVQLIPLFPGAGSFYLSQSIRICFQIFHWFIGVITSSIQLTPNICQPNRN